MTVLMIASYACTAVFLGAVLRVSVVTAQRRDARAALRWWTVAATTAGAAAVINGVSGFADNPIHFIAAAVQLAVAVACVFGIRQAETLLKLRQQKGGGPPSREPPP